jgi:hypothetical protein
MFYLTYMVAELRRRKGRTLLTAPGLGVGIGLVVTVSALSAGLDNAQDEVLEPLTGIGTDMSVTRPLKLSSGELSASERKELEEENGSARLRLRDLGEPGEKFSRTDFVAASQLSFPASQVGRSARSTASATRPAASRSTRCPCPARFRRSSSSPVKARRAAARAARRATSTSSPSA